MRLKCLCALLSVPYAAVVEEIKKKEIANADVAVEEEQKTDDLHRFPRDDAMHEKVDELIRLNGEVLNELRKMYSMFTRVWC